jgi:catechol 2,3-dioxygenase-like lactoylglutathione lyase family enzyme
VQIQGVDHVAVSVSDQERSISGYEDVLGLDEVHPKWERHPATLHRGGSGVALVAGEGTEPGFLHLAFRVDGASFVEGQERLGERGISFRVVDHGTAHSLSFEDPDRIRLELTTYDVG